MSEYRIQSETLEGIADAIREKAGDSALIAPEDMASEIASISGGDSPITMDTWTLASDYNKTTQDFYYGSYTDRTFEGLQFFVFDNNEATSQRARTAFIYTTGSGYTSFKTAFGRQASSSQTYLTWTGGASAGVEFNMTAGTVITRYKIALN